MRDINRIRRIVEDEDIRLDENDAISIKVWAARLQQEGAEVMLKDKIDAPLPDPGFPQIVLCFAYKPGFRKTYSV